VQQQLLLLHRYLKPNCWSFILKPIRILGVASPQSKRKYFLCSFFYTLQH
jgi:hypothetical protein